MKLLNRVLPVIICMLLIFAFFSVSASAEAEVIESGIFGDGLEWEIAYEEKENFEEEITLIISGSGNMPVFATWTDAPWLRALEEYGFSINRIVIDEGVTSVSDYSFAYCDRLISVSLPQSLQSIGMWAFGGCSYLSSVNIPSGCSSIGGAAFFGCTALTSIIIPQACNAIGDQAFYGCSRLRSITFEGSPPSVGELSFFGVTAAAWCSCLDRSWNENNMLQYGADRLTWGNHAYNEGEIIKEATCTEDGVFRKTCDICKETKDEAIPAKGHTEVIDPAVEPDDENDGLTEGRHCSVCGAVLVAQEVIPRTGYIVDLSSIPENGTMEINGKIVSNIEETVVSSTDSDVPAFAVVYEYGVSKGADQVKQYPASMKVYRLSRDDVNKTCTAEEIGACGNMLGYEGFSIRVTGVPGIRIITSVRESLRDYLIETGIERYKLIEYGTLAQWESILNGESLTFDTAGDHHAVAYSQGNDDKVFARYDGNLYYTNVIVPSSLDKCAQEIAMRPYMKFRNDEGKEMVIYGGTVSRSIGYIALQNKDVFKPGTKEYEYIWSLIRAAYGDRYLGSYKIS